MLLIGVERQNIGFPFRSQQKLICTLEMCAVTLQLTEYNAENPAPGQGAIAGISQKLMYAEARHSVG